MLDLPRGDGGRGWQPTPCRLIGPSSLTEAPSSVRLGDVAPEMAWVVVGPVRKPMSCQRSSHVWDVVILRREVSVS